MEPGVKAKSEGLRAKRLTANKNTSAAPWKWCIHRNVRGINQCSKCNRVNDE